MMATAVSEPAVIEKGHCMSVRCSGAGIGLLLAIIAAFAIVAFGLWGVIRWVRSDLQHNTAPVQRIDTDGPQRKGRSGVAR